MDRLRAELCDSDDRAFRQSIVIGPLSLQFDDETCGTNMSSNGPLTFSSYPAERRVS